MNILKYRYVSRNCVSLAYLQETGDRGESEAFQAHMDSRIFQQLGAELRKHFEVITEDTDCEVTFSVEVYAMSREDLTRELNEAYARGRSDMQKEMTERIIAVQRESLL